MAVVYLGQETVPLNLSFCETENKGEASVYERARESYRVRDRKSERELVRKTNIILIF